MTGPMSQTEDREQTAYERAIVAIKAAAQLLGGDAEAHDIAYKVWLHMFNADALSSCNGSVPGRTGTNPTEPMAGAGLTGHNPWTGPGYADTEGGVGPVERGNRVDVRFDDP